MLSSFMSGAFPLPMAIGPAGRVGPRPLWMHLSAAMAVWGSAPLSFYHLMQTDNETDTVADIRSRFEKLDNAPLMALGLQAEAQKRLLEFTGGIARYLHHPYQRQIVDASPVYQRGSCDLRVFLPDDVGAIKSALFVIPSLINRSTILDLDVDYSLCRWLAAQGVAVYMIDWGEPVDELGFGIEDYINERLVPCFEVAQAHLSGMAGSARGKKGREIPMHCMGYCMGGLIAAAFARLRPADIASLVMLATPWDFHAGQSNIVNMIRAYMNVAEPVIKTTGCLPVDMIQGLFLSLDPLLAARKYRKFNTMDQESERARRFVVVEDWVNNGVSLAGPVANTCLRDWYLDNATGRGVWSIAGHIVTPNRLEMPVLSIIPVKDRLVPYESAHAFHTGLKKGMGQVIKPDMGHIGVVVGTKAREQVWEPIHAWLVEKR